MVKDIPCLEALEVLYGIGQMMPLVDSLVSTLNPCDCLPYHFWGCSVSSIRRRSVFVSDVNVNIIVLLYE